MTSSLHQVNDLLRALGGEARPFKDTGLGFVAHLWQPPEEARFHEDAPSVSLDL
jgi:hypothetical protein